MMRKLRLFGLLLVFGLVIVGYCVEASPDEEGSLVDAGSCASNQFRCTNGQCIPANWHCDSHRDCDDGSDEAPECLLSQHCRPEQFQCALTRKCLPTGWVCDEELDCGTSPELGDDTSDEDPKQCHKGIKCSWNQAACGDGVQCIPISKFCDNHGDCPGNSDEWDFCRNDTGGCDRLRCTYGCRLTPEGPRCYCPEGKRPEGSQCIDADECELDDSCAQKCTNTEGSFECSCVSGYNKTGNDCIAINVPDTEPASLIFSTQSEIRRVTLGGKPFPGNSSLRILNSNALEFIHRNHTICYVHHNVTKASLICASINDLNQRWQLKVISPLLEVESIQQMALDWVSGNWYFLDDQRELIILCTGDLRWCNMLIEFDLSKPRALALDPTVGYLFFTKWGHSPPMLERCKMDGSERKAIVDHKIVYPYGVSVDYPNQYVYWVDTYLDYVERVNYDGKNRKTIMRGIRVQNLYGITVFENRLFVSSWYNSSILELSQKLDEERNVIVNISRPYNVYVFHRQRQPDALMRTFFDMSPPSSSAPIPNALPPEAVSSIPQPVLEAQSIGALPVLTISDPLMLTLDDINGDDGWLERILQNQQVENTKPPIVKEVFVEPHVLPPKRKRVSKSMHKNTPKVGETVGPSKVGVGPTTSNMETAAGPFTSNVKTAVKLSKSNVRNKNTPKVGEAVGPSMVGVGPTTSNMETAAGPSTSNVKTALKLSKSNVRNTEASKRRLPAATKPTMSILSNILTYGTNGNHERVVVQPVEQPTSHTNVPTTSHATTFTVPEQHTVQDPIEHVLGLLRSYAEDESTALEEQRRESELLTASKSKVAKMREEQQLLTSDIDELMKRKQHLDKLLEAEVKVCAVHQVKLEEKHAHAVRCAESRRHISDRFQPFIIH